MKNFISVVCFCICLSLAKAATLPKNCAGVKRSGVQLISLPYSGLEPFQVYCDAQQMNGNWTVIQRRIDGSVDFYRSWHEYKNGFGNPEYEHWIGLERLHLMTSYEAQELLIVMEDFTGALKYAMYDSFEIGNETQSYYLKSLGQYSGFVGNSLSYHVGKPFATYDRDTSSNDARNAKSGWWALQSPDTNLNGMYLKGKYFGTYPHGIFWTAFHMDQWYSLKSVRIMMRPKPY